MKSAPSIERLRELFILDVEAGKLVRRISTSPRWQAGQVAGFLHASEKQGYRWVTIDGAKYREHLVIWFMLYGEWLPRRIDHKDRDRGNNRPNNLRKSSESQQRQNAAKRSDNTSGFRGVSANNGRWTAEIWIDGKRTYLGCFGSPAEAGEVARQARLKHFGAYAPAYDHQAE